jgi:uncharacterized protein YfaS (alpha-2-macroglobulin family)
LQWIEQVTELKRQSQPGDHSLFAASSEPDEQPQEFTIPKPNGRKAFEVIGIPLPKPGLYVVEVASQLLGSQLHAEDKPYFAQSAVVVTNLAVHLQRGQDASLVWVTSLDRGKPVENAEVTLSDCTGKHYFSGKSDANGVLRIAQALPHPKKLPTCQENGHGQGFFIVSAQLADDTAYLLSSWDEGIEPYQFRLPYADQQPEKRYSTVLDRSLFRTGQTLSMKHFVRQPGSKGLSLPPPKELPRQVIIRHSGSQHSYPLPVQWDGQRIAESQWQIPNEARLGHYQVVIPHLPEKGAEGGLAHEEEVSAQFWVEAFRMPTLRATLTPSQPHLIATNQIAYDLQVNYLAGGTAGAIPVKLRGLIRPKILSFPELDDYEFNNGPVQEGTSHRDESNWDEATQPEAAHAASEESASQKIALPLQTLTLSGDGTARASFDHLPLPQRPQELVVEMDYPDANGEQLTVAQSTPLLPSQVILGLRDDGKQSDGSRTLEIVALDPSGKRLAEVPVTVEMFAKTAFAHRKRLLGGFYAYEHTQQISKLQLQPVCSGKTDGSGRLRCHAHLAGKQDETILQATALDSQNRPSITHISVYSGYEGEDFFWPNASANNRMAVHTDKALYQPGEEALIQVQTPFPEATLLLTVEREGVLHHTLQTLRRENPIVRLPIQGNYAPNAFVSAVLVRGRVGEVAPTALLDLGKPTFRIGFTSFKVGWQAHTLQVQVKTDQTLYKVRQKAQATIQVTPPAGQKLPAQAEVALSAIDEGLLELRANPSWNLLEAMMQPRLLGVTPATSLGRIIGRRHYGLKSLPVGGGGGRLPSRQLLEPLLLWQGRLKLDEHGRAQVTIPINDAVSSFRVVAVAHAGSQLFGTGYTSFRTHQELTLFAALPPLLREEDQFQASFTVRNSREEPLPVTVRATITAQPREGGQAPPAAPLPPQSLTLGAGESRLIHWPVTVPPNTRQLRWQIQATSPHNGEAQDSLQVEQQVIPALPVRVVQSTTQRLNQPLTIPVQKPPTAESERGGVRLHVQPTLSGALAGVQDYFAHYPYTCLEQRLSKSVALHDAAAWQALANSLPANLDKTGLAKYFPSSEKGSDILTGYLLDTAQQNGWSIPKESLERMVKALVDRVTGRVPFADAPYLSSGHLALRKLAALQSISRYQSVDRRWLDTLAIDPAAWPDNSVVDWLLLLQRSAWPDQEPLLQEAKRVIRNRLEWQGSRLGFAKESHPALGWMMVSAQTNAQRLLLAVLDDPHWQEELPRLLQGLLASQKNGHWSGSPANAWGTLAVRAFANRFEKTPIQGSTQAQLEQQQVRLEWQNKPAGESLDLAWPSAAATLSVQHQGSGTPWLTVESRAAQRLQQPLQSGYRLQRTLIPVEQKQAGVWTQGDLLRVRFTFEAQADRTWVVLDDPIPAGSAILGSGSNTDSQLLGAAQSGDLRPSFSERTFASYRAYFEWLPRGKWQLEYTLRLNNPGHFTLPSSRIEAMYSPDMFAELPVEAITVQP